ncbi:calmodulin-binding protein [Streptomyces sp. NPDC093260]|uniref:BP74-related protein n=1 Tax=Streptomyces sp. NPDC093260 TaxID=3155073 RepID=UPI0034310544
MRRLLAKLGGVAAAVLLTVGMSRPAQAAAPAYFEFTDITGSKAVFELTDETRIQEARDILSGKEKDRVHVLGRIVHRPAAWNPGWSYHYDTSSVQFFEVAIEVCDATIPYVEDHLDEAGGAFLPGNWWCPWTSKLIREVPAP